MPSKKISFINASGVSLAGRLEFPLSITPKAFAVFAHVFTGSKNIASARHITRALTLNGIAVLRFDFAGLGDSEGDFSNTNFTSNVNDIKAAAQYLEDHYMAPSILVGHSLGGAASIFAGDEIDSVEAIATVGAPSEPEHVTHLFGCKIEDIEEHGEAEVEVGGRHFVIKKQFLDDLRSKDMFSTVKNLRKALLIMHSPQDVVVEIENAAKIYQTAFHPKSFVTLDNANHMLTDKTDAYYVGNVIATWAQRYVKLPEEGKLETHKQVVAQLGSTGFTTRIQAGNHGFVADESEALGGNDFGPSPYELLNAALAACTAMTLQMYARRKKWDLKDVKVHLSYDRSYKEDCDQCSESDRRLEHFDKSIELVGDLDESQKARLLEIAERCPVHRTLSGASMFHSEIL